MVLKGAADISVAPFLLLLKKLFMYLYFVDFMEVRFNNEVKKRLFY